MKAPRFFLGLTVLFWGWHMDQWVLAGIAAALLEAPRLVRWRVDFSAVDLWRVWDLCVLLFLAAALYAYADDDVATGPARVVPWLPVILLPLVVANAWSGADRVTLSAFFWLRRPAARAGAVEPPLGWLVPYWYFVVCVLAAGMMNVTDLRFFGGVTALGVWLLWTVRNRTVSVVVWLLMSALAVKGGVAGFTGMSNLQGWAEGVAGELIGELATPEQDITQRRTAIGAVGRLKLSSRILFRVTTEPNQAPPGLFRTATFNQYGLSRGRSTWAIDRQDFDPVFASGPDATTWRLSETPATARVRVSINLPAGIGILPLPAAPTALDELFTEIIETNHYGSVRTREALPLVRYRAWHTPNASTIDAPPTAADRVVPAGEAAVLRAIAEELGLAGLAPEAALHRVAAFFAERFTYSRYLRGARGAHGDVRTALGLFLTVTRSGHCEYFATATTLLLRAAGLPARYAVGFAIPDPEADRDLYLVRGRHAHAWTLVYVDGVWREFDTTPAIWDEVERAGAARAQPLLDAAAWLKHWFQTWRYYGAQGLIPKILLALLSPFLLRIIWRLVRRQRAAQSVAAPTGASAAARPGADSEFYQIEQRLRAANLERRAGETLTAWLDRLEETGQPRLDLPVLREIVALHYGYRFDPAGLAASARAELREKSAAWLTRRA